MIYESENIEKIKNDLGQDVVLFFKLNVKTEKITWIVQVKSGRLIISSEEFESSRKAYHYWSCQ